MPDMVEVWTTVNGEERLAGTARFSYRKAVSTTFTYDTQYIKAEGSYSLDDVLRLEYGGGTCQQLPPSFRDCAPDRWGQCLIDKEHREKSDDVAPRSLTDVDYLLGVSDITRQGALRFKSRGQWLGENTSIPPTIDLYELLQAAHKVAENAETHEELKALLDVGTTALGGAHPKASVRDGDKLMLAKFSHPQDKYDVIGLEKTMLDLQVRCGISVPSSKLVRFGNNAALLTQRFDRSDGRFDGVRIPYKSGMSLMGTQDGERVTYVDLLLEMQQRFGERDIEEMLRRICFSYVFNNTDDHLKNHGFLLMDGRWRLSPCFDVNPSLIQKERATPITGSSKPEHEQLKELFELLEISAGQQRKVVEKVASVARHFSALAARNKVPRKELEAVASIANSRARRLGELADLIV